MVASSSGAGEDASQSEGDTPAAVKKTPVKKVSFDPSVTEAPTKKKKKKKKVGVSTTSTPTKTGAQAPASAPAPAPAPALAPVYSAEQSANETLFRINRVKSLDPTNSIEKFFSTPIV